MSDNQPIYENPLNSWYKYDIQDVAQSHERFRRSSSPESEAKQSHKDDKLDSSFFDPKTKLVNMIRSFADSVENVDW